MSSCATRRLAKSLFTLGGTEMWKPGSLQSTSKRVDSSVWNRRGSLSAGKLEATLSKMQDADEGASRSMIVFGSSPVLMRTQLHADAICGIPLRYPAGPCCGIPP